MVCGMPATSTATARGASATANQHLDTEVFDGLTAALGATNDAARARLVDIDRKTLWRWRTGRYAPNLTVAQRIADQLGTTVDRLFPRRAA